MMASMKQAYGENETNLLQRKHVGRYGHWAGMSYLQLFGVLHDGDDDDDSNDAAEGDGDVDDNET